MADNLISSGQAEQQMCDLVREIAASLVDRSDAVRLESIQADGETIIRLFVAEEDLGKVIGKNGRTARSIRTIVSAAGNKMRGRFAVDIRSSSE